MCQKLKKSVKPNSEASARDRRAALQAKLEKYFETNGVMDQVAGAERAYCRQGRRAESKKEALNISKEELEKRGVKFEGSTPNSAGTPQLHFTIRDMGSTITVSSDEEDILGNLDEKILETRKRAKQEVKQVV